MGEKRLEIVALASMLCLVVSVLLSVTMPPKPETTGEMVTLVIGLSYNHQLLLAILSLLPPASFLSGLMVWDIFYHPIIIEESQKERENKEGVR